MGSSPTADTFSIESPEIKVATRVMEKGSLGCHDSLAERSKAVAQGAIPKGRGLELHSCHFSGMCYYTPVAEA